MSILSKDNLSPTERVEIQMRTCNTFQSAGDELNFNNSVLTLLGNIRPDLRKRVIDRKSEYTTIEKKYEYVEDGGWRIGSPESPIYSNNRGDIDYDPRLRQVRKIMRILRDEKTGEEYEAEEEKETFGESVLISPILREEPNIDYNQLSVIIQEELYEAGQTWPKPKKQQ